MPEPVDAIFSNATFHWIKDPTRCSVRCIERSSPAGNWSPMRRGATSTRSGVADAIAGEEPFVPTGSGPGTAGDTETAERLSRAGFSDVQTWLEPKSVRPADPRAFVRTVCLVRHLDPLPDDLRGPFVERVLTRSGEPFMLAYVRLNMTARRPSQR